MELLALELVTIWDPGALKARTLAARPRCQACSPYFFKNIFIQIVDYGISDSCDYHWEMKNKGKKKE